MHQGSQGARYNVIDDFLRAEELESVREIMRVTSFDPTESVVNPSLDGAAYRGGGMTLPHDAPLDRSDTVGSAAFGSILDAVRDAKGLFGLAGKDWAVVSLAFWQYPSGTRLGWHNDEGGNRTGEFILYVHEQWKPGWGGELLLLDRDIGDDYDAEVGSPVERVEAVVERSNTELVSIVPKPNRMVLVKAGTAHCISRVDPSAGAHLRCSLTGFASMPLRKRAGTAGNLKRMGALLEWGDGSPEESRSPNAVVGWNGQAEQEI